MKCPRCQSQIRGSEKLEVGLAAGACRGCHGHWMSSYQYWRWRERQPEHVGAVPAGEIEPASESSDSKSALICAECGHILRKYRIAREVPFRVDQCGHCGGMWFDAGEWAALRELGLHGSVQDVFTAVWQRALRVSDGRAAYQTLYSDRFGEEAYAELRRIREWLESQGEQRASMLLYLSDPDPYS